ncbi:histidine phosphatase family protein [Gracilibacillus caseinilyticus]|uniref:Histidine phosphatase family protein n=1 Tax=Gracilibacillus caseinilyticus TaxID=2932256 RepID=A0ABY4EW74_9BACI|nr:histidine phosphatase family protein [Gracilibacillus caseinilyticus]UOQ48478.1 histidine phosphatase family protein [Gracilibacillus caseinilyticus]
MTSICLVRHGETDWNALGKIQGQTDIPLNNDGKSQAEECGQYLLTLDWDMLISSSLKRASETAHIINKYVQLPYEEMDAFRERRFGVAEGMTVFERMEAFPDGVYPNAEDMPELIERVVAGLEEVHQRYAGKKIILVAHGAVINALLSHFSKGAIGSGKTKLVNGSINLMERLEEKWHIHHYNQTKHLTLYKEKGSV